MINLYDKYILPKVSNAVCGTKPVMRQREKVVPLATGRVLEIGVGSGLNFKYYNPENVNELLALDPSEEMWTLVKNNLGEQNIDLKFIKGVAENMPIDDRSVDSIVITYSTIPDYHAAIEEFRRVLKSSGSIIFCEHGLSPDKSVRRC
ncbi:MAG: class I SAM-dependent methyltransferase [Bacteroidota bacterium]